MAGADQVPSLAYHGMTVLDADTQMIDDVAALTELHKIHGHPQPAFYSSAKLQKLVSFGGVFGYRVAIDFTNVYNAFVAGADDITRWKYPMMPWPAPGNPNYMPPNMDPSVWFQDTIQPGQLIEWPDEVYAAYFKLSGSQSDPVPAAWPGAFELDVLWTNRWGIDMSTRYRFTMGGGSDANPPTLLVLPVIRFNGRIVYLPASLRPALTSMVNGLSLVNAPKFILTYWGPPPGQTPGVLAVEVGLVDRRMIGRRFLERTA
jgi:hypothetical protein